MGVEMEEGRQGVTGGILLSVLWAGIFSHKRTSLILASDCPEEFLIRERFGVDFELLKRTIVSLPKSLVIKEYDVNAHIIDKRQNAMINWLFKLPHPFKDLRPSSFSQFAEEFPSLSSGIRDSGLVPRFVLKYHGNIESQEQIEIFNRAGSLVGFHGSGFENFLSIYRHGLAERCIKYGQGLFGDGLYFSTDLKVARNFTKFYHLPSELVDILGSEQVKVLGNRIGCVLVSEIAKDPDHVKFTLQDQSYVGFSGEASIAPHYVLAESNTYVKYRYIFVYSEYSPPHRTNWIAILVVVYVIVLALVAALKSRTFQRFISRYL